MERKKTICNGPRFDVTDTVLLEIEAQLASMNEKAPPKLSDFDFDSALSDDEDVKRDTLLRASRRD